MYDNNPQTVHFHLQELERQAKRCIGPKSDRRSPASDPVVGMIVVAAIAGAVLKVASLISGTNLA